MTVISPNGSAYALVASSGLNSNQQALDDVAAAAGNSSPPTLISLSSQAQELTNFSTNLVNLTQADNSFEATRGLGTTVNPALTKAYTTAAQRLTLTGIYANGQQTSASTALDLSGGATTLADILLDSYNSLGGSGNQSTTGNQSGSGNSDSNNLFSIINPATTSASSDATSLTLTPGETNKSGTDPYDREIPTKYAVAGQTTLSVSKDALKADTINVPIAAGLVPGNSIPVVGSTVAGPATATNDGVATTVKTGNANSVVALDTTDPENADTRTSDLNVTTGNGSNVVFVAGNNDSVVKTGTGDSFVEGEGNGVVYGGGGNDFLVANTVSGGSGNDTIFASSFAYGGTGNDFITLFNVASTSGSGSSSSSSSSASTTTPTAIGGSGNDTIVANVKATIVGGSGNDTIIARQGGEISSGNGKNEITTEGKADVTVGNGNNNLDLVFGGTATVGNGNNTITANAYTDTTIGSGNNTLTLQAGGSVSYNAGGGTNQILFGPPIASDTADAGKPNVINLNNLLYSDVTVTSEDGFISIAENNSKASLNITSSPGAAPVVLQFSKNGETQEVTFANGAAQVGPVAS